MCMYLDSRLMETNLTKKIETCTNYAPRSDNRNYEIRKNMFWPIDYQKFRTEFEEPYDPTI